MKFNWGTGIILFFVLFFVLAGLFINFAVHQNNDLVSEDHYKLGAEYTTQMQTIQRSLAYRDSIVVQSETDGISILLGKNIRELTDSVSLYFFKSTDKNRDLTIHAATSPSIKVGKERLVHGRYKIFVSWEKKHERFEVEKECFVE
ncbi:MAG: FixH family protein [Marinilabiliales bacterium]|nr:FixH family protein [Marinilabiliales bacterium]